jgi:DNA-binding LacI/PurR family transcriptional regulator
MSESSAILSDAPGVRVVRSLRQWIAEGRLSPGEPLPSERHLAHSLQVARGTVRAALEQLSQEGFISADGRRRVVRRETAAPGDMQTIVSQAICVLQRPLGPEVTDRIRGGGWQHMIERGALDAVYEAGYHGISLHPERIESATLDRLVRSAPLGVVIGRYGSHEMGRDPRQAFLEAGVPVVAYGDPPENQPFDRVLSDHDAGSHALTRHLIGRGCRRILRLWPAMSVEPYWIIGRNRGYERAMREAGLDPMPALAVDAPIPHSEGRREQFILNARAFSSYLIPYLAGERKIDAIMMASDGSVFAMAAAIRLFGLVPGRDVQIAGYDNYWEDCIDRDFENFAPIATVDKKNTECGKEMVRLLVERIKGNRPDGPQVKVVQPELVVPPAAAS